MPMTVSELKEGYPDIIGAVEQAAYKTGHDEGYAKGKDEGLATGTEAERERIKAIDALSLPGHEKLISEMKYDGKTTAADAAVKIISAEKAIRETKLATFRGDSPPVVATVEAPPDHEEKKDFNALVAEHQKEKGCGRAEAIKAIVATYPEAHKAYLASLKPQKKED